MSQISFKTVLLQENQIFVTDFMEQINLTPASAATHLPNSIYQYMNDNFFDYLCQGLEKVVDINNKNVTIKDLSSYAAPMQSCQCSGEDYFGLPSIEFGL